MCKSCSEKSSDVGGRMARTRRATITWLDSLHDPQARAPYSSLPTSNHRTEIDTSRTGRIGPCFKRILNQLLTLPKHEHFPLFLLFPSFSFFYFPFRWFCCQNSPSEYFQTFC